MHKSSNRSGRYEWLNTEKLTLNINKIISIAK